MKTMSFSNIVNALIWSTDLTVYMWIDKIIIRYLIAEEELMDFYLLKKSYFFWLVSVYVL